MMGKKVNNLLEIKIKKLNTLAKVPTKGTAGSAGWDLYAALPQDVLIKPNETKKISTEISIAIPSSEFVGLIFARSGLSVSFGIAPANAVGVIDSDYRGELVVPLHNYSTKDYFVHHGDRIAQFLLMPVIEFKFAEVQELNNTLRGANGFGSTGLN